MIAEPMKPATRTLWFSEGRNSCVLPSIRYEASGAGRSPDVRLLGALKGMSAAASARVASRSRARNSPLPGFALRPRPSIVRSWR